MSLTYDQIKTVRATVPVLQSHGTQITTAFYNNLLHDAPELNNIFSTKNQKSGEQPRALAGALFAYASYIDDLGVLAPAVERICQKHVSLSIQPAHYDIVGRYLLAAMGEILGDAMTPEILDAWTAAYTQLAKLMIGKEAQLYNDFDDWISWRRFKIARKVQESESITSFYFAPEDGKSLPAYQPGQYISLQIHVPSMGYLQSRQYSLSEAPNRDYYRVSIKREGGRSATGPGLISNIFHNDKNVGDIVELTHPAGDFFLDLSKEESSPVVLISAGVGVTPMISILGSLIDQKSTRPISFIHTARSTAQQAFSSYIRDVSNSQKNFNAVIFKSNIAEEDVKGVHYHYDSRMDLQKHDLGADLYLSDTSATYFICGPPAFMTETAAYLKSQGVTEEKIKMELFGTGDVE